jgi:putative colanic acid biosynthesis UDP-glucose lipid carrier transferase
MNPPVAFRQSISVAIVYLLQSISPAVIAAVLIPLLCEVFNHRFDQQYVILMILASVFTLLLVKEPADISLRLSAGYLQTISRFAFRWAVVLGILLFIGFAAKYSAEYSRKVVTTWVLVTPLISALVSVVLSGWLRRLLMSPANIRTAVIAGLNDSSRAFAQQLRESPEACLSIRGFFDDRSTERLGIDEKYPVIGGLSDLAGYVKQHRISVIFVALPMRHVQRVMDLLDDLRDTTVSIYYLPDIFVFDLIQARTGEILGTPVVAMCETPFYGFQGIVKRMTDTVFALIILIPELPVMLICAILIKLTSPGSVLFKQRRYGLDGKEIVVYKFRTMTVSEDGEDFVQAKKNDPRITRVGEVLRRYSLDELPQLFNVIQGRMSLVGPRPHPIALNEQYRTLIKGYMIRHKVRPGLTGLAQVSGCRGETAELDEMKARIHYDLEYLRHWTPFLDVKILFLTVFRVLWDEKAY